MSLLTHLDNLPVGVSGTVLVVLGEHLRQQLHVDVHLLQHVYSLGHLVDSSFILKTVHSMNVFFFLFLRTCRIRHRTSEFLLLSPCFWSVCWPPGGPLGFYCGEALRVAEIQHSGRRKQRPPSKPRTQESGFMHVASVTFPMSSLSNTGCLGLVGGEGIRVRSSGISGSCITKPCQRQSNGLIAS